MRWIAILRACGLAAALCSGCALDAGETDPARAAEPAGKDEQAFDASIFRFTTWVPDNGEGESGGWQRAVAPLSFVDTRGSILGKTWVCIVSVQLPIRLRYVTISSDRAAELTARVANAAGSTVMHSAPSWPVVGLFCRKLAATMQALFVKAPEGSYGARVISK
jgi:hypothetical protein